MRRITFGVVLGLTVFFSWGVIASLVHIDPGMNTVQIGDPVRTSSALNAQAGATVTTAHTTGHGLSHVCVKLSVACEPLMVVAWDNGAGSGFDVNLHSFTFGAADTQHCYGPDAAMVFASDDEIAVTLSGGDEACTASTTIMSYTF